MLSTTKLALSSLSRRPIKVLLTGATGGIAYNLAFRLADGRGFDRPVELRIHARADANGGMRKQLLGVAEELSDTASSHLSSVKCFTDLNEASEDVDFALLVGSSPRRPGQERADLIRTNAEMFKKVGQALNKTASKNVRIVTVGNPANTNALIAAHNAPTLPRSNFSALTRLDHNRGVAQIASKLKITPNEITDFIIWGNHSPTMVPDISYTKVNNELICPEIMHPAEPWVTNEFAPAVQQRGGTILEMRGASSSASAAAAIIDHIRSWITDSEDFYSMAIASPNGYGIDENVVFSYPMTTVFGQHSIVENLELNEWVYKKMKGSEAELIAERDIVRDFLQ